MERDLTNLYWIGGSGCSGKSSIVRLLEGEHGFTTYHCDDHWGEHGERSNPVDHPGTIRFWSEFEEFCRLPPEEFVEAFRAFVKEDFAMVLEDLAAIPNEKTLVEGVTLEPDFVLEVADPQKVIFMIASEEFQRANFLRRDMQSTVFQGLKDPEGSFEAFVSNLAFQTRSLCDHAMELGLKVIFTDENSTLSGNLELVKEHFRL